MDYTKVKLEKPTFYLTITRGEYMKIIFQAIASSILIHLVYMLGTMLVGFIQTLIYRPDLETAWKQLDNLQNEAVFGITFSPYLMIVSIVSFAFVCWIILLVVQKKDDRFMAR